MSFLCPPQTTRDSLGLLLVRVVVGVAFLFHGWSKINQPFTWMGEKAPVPAALQAAAAISEFGGGAAILVGVVTRFAGFFLAITMATAAYMGHISKGDPFVSKGGPSWELAAIYFACAVLLLLAGPGRCSLDALLAGRSRRDATTDS